MMSKKEYFSNLFKIGDISSKESLAVFVFRITSLILSYLITILLTNNISVDSYGSFVYAFSWIAVLTPLCCLGFDNILIREIAVFYAQKSFGKIKSIIFRSVFVTMLCSIIVALLIFCANNYFSFSTDKESSYALNLALISLPLFTISALLQSILQGLKKPMLAQLITNFLRQLFLLFAFLTLIYLFPQPGISKLVATNTVILPLTIGMGIFMLYRHNIFQSIRTKSDEPNLTKSSLVFFLISVFGIINLQIDVIILNFYNPSSDVAIYSVVAKSASLISVFLGIINYIIAPLISELYKKLEMDKLQKLITKSVRLVFIMSLFLSIVFYFFGEIILGLFGKEYIAGYHSLIILIVGYVFNVAAGSVGYILRMTNNEDKELISMAVGATANILLNMLLIPMYGMIGAAMATATSMIIWNIISYFYVVDKTQIRPTIFGKLL